MVRSGHPTTLIPMPSPLIRPLDGSETALLETATLGNMNWSGERISIDEIRAKPEYAHYTRIVPVRGDFGVVAEIDGGAVGVAWAVFLPRSDAGYGFVDEQTPEVSLWVSASHRKLGHGREVLRTLIAEGKERGLAQVSLSVEADNHAKNLYASEGFVDVPGGEADGVMVRVITAG